MELTTLDNTPVSRLGLASQYLKETGCVRAAFAAGINYFFSYSLPSRLFLDELNLLLATHRESIFVALGSEKRDRQTLNHTLDRIRQTLNVDLVDAFFGEYISPKDDPNDIQHLADTFYDWKAKGYIRYVGMSTHNRAIALNLIHLHQCDVLMHRYNMAHRKAEIDLFPAAVQADIPVIAFTCTRWATLLRLPLRETSPQMLSGLDRPPTAAECYQFSLHPGAVRLALTSPAALAELTSNLEVLHKPLLTASELAHWQHYGDVVYGTGQDAFETQWA
ncbi:aldo/keto reductase [Oscillatoria sp. FACHB-1407]|uniref:aldo/keto reductase n=1 Tax=Oscillatoria sp. FACHB-1407 TaxID=2692847 RepID=UPI0016863340|nr:aldo/keto reductase [Oscillatoria sp. FACHB-1407]MBD2461626.1 aldo/keto reductase [Oscillatoria sp. FACHB-1407]